MQLPTIGERIRELRLQQAPTLSQRELAERAGVSVDLIRKLEQGSKQTARLVSLHKIARALDVDITVLLARPVRVETSGDADEDSGVVPTRLALTAIWDDGEPVSVAELEQSARYASRALRASAYDVLAGLLPGLITTARATVREHPTPAANAALSDIYQTAASMLALLGHIDLAYLAMERATSAADRSEDELRRAAQSGHMSWLLLHQTGSFDQARRLAIDAADQTEPRNGQATPQRLAVWNGLLVAGAVAAARDERTEEADELLNAAESGARRLEEANRADQPKPRYGLPHGAAYVVMQQVDVAVVTDRPGRALQMAKRMPPNASPPLIARARHLTDIASAQTSLGRDREATDTLLLVERTAPSWIRHSGYPRTVVRELLERERRARTPRLRALAARLNVA